jgi:hypothetical protein
VNNGVADHVRAFIAAHVNSVEQVEVLILLLRSPQKSWTPKEVADELRTSPDSALDRLEDLTKRGCLVRDADQRYRYGPKDAELSRVTSDLAVAYEERRYTIIQMIFSKPVDHIRTFANAFRLRKEDGDG